MSKRVANSKAPTKARNGRIRIGWRRTRAIQALTKQQAQLSLGEMTGEVKETMKRISSALKSVMPKKIMRRHQGR